jgi:hypothetical protein
MLFGRPVFSAFSQVTVMNRLIEAILVSGSWLIVRNAIAFGESALCNLYDYVQAVSNAVQFDRSSMAFEGKVLQIAKGCRFFVLVTPNDLESREFPPQLRSLLKPVGVTAPDLAMVVRSSLEYRGFKHCVDLSEAIVACTSMVNTTFSILERRYSLNLILNAIDSATQLLAELTQLNHPELQYSLDSYKCEQFVICHVLYHSLAPLLRPAQVSTLIQFLYASFRMEPKIEDFKEKLATPVFGLDKIRAEIDALCRNEITKMRVDFPLDYIVNQVVTLYQMMHTYPVIAIVGPIKSGKTLIVDLLSKVMEAKSQPAFKVFDLFHECDIPARIFGCPKGQEGGCVYGQIQSFLWELSNVHCHRILRFNGPVSPEFMNWLSAMITLDALRLDTLDTVAFHPLFHILIETESLANVTPAFLSFGAILPMTNVQIYRAPAIDRTVCEMSAPELLFARMEHKLEFTFRPDFIGTMKDLFLQIATDFISRRVWSFTNVS